MNRLFRAGLAGLAFVGLIAMPAEAASEVLYFTPSPATATVGSPVVVAIRVNSGTEPVNAVQANMDYDPAKLQYESVDAVGSAFGLTASTIQTPGSVKLARATVGGGAPVTGDVLFANVKFKALAAGPVTVKIGAASHVVRSTDSTDLLPASSGGSAQATATPTPAPKASGGFLGLNNGALLAGFGVAAGVLLVFALVLHWLLPKMTTASAADAADAKPGPVVYPKPAPPQDSGSGASSTKK